MMSLWSSVVRIAPIAGLALGACAAEAPPKPPVETPVLAAEQPAAPAGPAWVKLDGPIQVKTCLPQQAEFALRPFQRVFECSGGGGWTDNVEGRMVDAEHALVLFAGPRDDLWPPIRLVAHGASFGPQQPGFQGEFGCGLGPVGPPLDAEHLDACAPIRLEDDGSIVIATGADTTERVTVDPSAYDLRLLTGTEHNPAVITYRTPLGVRVATRNAGRWSAPTPIADTLEQDLPCPSVPPCPAMCVASNRRIAELRTFRRPDNGALLFVAYERTTSTGPSIRRINTMCGEVPGSVCRPENAYMCSTPELTSKTSLTLSLWDVTSGAPLRVSSIVVEGASFASMNVGESSVEVMVAVAEGSQEWRSLAWPAPKTKP